MKDTVMHDIGQQQCLFPWFPWFLAKRCGHTAPLIDCGFEHLAGIVPRRKYGICGAFGSSS